MLRRLLAALILTGLMASITSARPADAKWVWDGHTWTVAIVSAIGAAAIGFFLKYESALLRSKGSVKQAETMMNLTIFGTPHPTSSPDAYQVSLQDLRGIVMADVAYEVMKINNPPAQTKWRQKFETLRSCWNTVLVTPGTPTPSPSPTTSSSSSPTSSSKPKDHSSSSPKDQKKNHTPPALVLNAWNMLAYNAPSFQSDFGGAIDAHHLPLLTPTTRAGTTNQTTKKDQGHPQAHSNKNATNLSPRPSPSASPLSSPSKPTCSDLFNDALTYYKGDVADANKLITSGTFTPKLQNGTPLPSPSPLTTPDAENLLFQLQTQADATDLAAYLSTSPSLLSQLTNENIGSYATDDYVRNLFLATAAIQFIDELPTPPPVIQAQAAGAPGPFSWLETLASDCSGIKTVTSGFTCLNDVSSIETTYENAHLQREACYWSKHVIMPTYSDIALWAMRRGPYDPNQAANLGRASNVPVVPNSLITIPLPSPVTSDEFLKLDPTTVKIAGINNTAVYTDAADAIKASMTVLTMPSGC